MERDFKNLVSVISTAPSRKYTYTHGENTQTHTSKTLELTRVYLHKQTFVESANTRRKQI